MGLQRIALDVETDTSVNGLVASVTRVVSVAVYLAPELHVVFDAPDERRLLDDLAAFLGGQAPSVIETWNGRCFDAPMLAARAAASGSRLEVDLRVRPGSPGAGPPYLAACRGRIGSHAHRDLMVVWRHWATTHLGTCRLKSVARAFGLAPLELDAAHLTRYSRSQVAAYNLSDARVTWLLGAISISDPDLWMTPDGRCRR